MKITILSLVISLFFMSETSDAAPPKRVASSPAPAVSMNEKLLMAGQSAIKEKLKDPESANFRDLVIHGGEAPVSGTYYVCGEVNSKNSYGGYAGFTKFFSMVFYFEKQEKALPATAGLWLDNVDYAKMKALFDRMCVN